MSDPGQQAIRKRWKHPFFIFISPIDIFKFYMFPKINIHAHEETYAPGLESQSLFFFYSPKTYLPPFAFALTSSRLRGEISVVYWGPKD